MGTESDTLRILFFFGLLLIEKYATCPAIALAKMFFFSLTKIPLKGLAEVHWCETKMFSMSLSPALSWNGLWTSWMPVASAHRHTAGIPLQIANTHYSAQHILFHSCPIYMGPPIMVKRKSAQPTLHLCGLGGQAVNSTLSTLSNKTYNTEGVGLHNSFY